MVNICKYNHCIGCVEHWHCRPHGKNNHGLVLGIYLAVFFWHGLHFWCFSWGCTMLQPFFCGTTVDIPNEVTFFSQQERELPGLPGMRGLHE